MSSALEESSRRAIMNELRRQGPLSVDELVERTGLSKTAARAHITRMERDAFVVRVPAAQPTQGRGRPRAIYELTESGAALFPTSDSALLSQFVEFLSDEGKKELVASFFSQMWTQRREQVEAKLGRSLSEVSLQERLDALEAMLEHEDFMPVIERVLQEDGSQLVTVRECNCPMSAAARASHVPCRLEIDFLASTIGAKPRSVAIARGRSERCSFEFVVPGDKPNPPSSD